MSPEVFLDDDQKKRLRSCTNCVGVEAIRNVPALNNILSTPIIGAEIPEHLVDSARQLAQLGLARELEYISGLYRSGRFAEASIRTGSSYGLVGMIDVVQSIDAISSQETI